MKSFSVTAPGASPAEVHASNWLAALGLALPRLGEDANELERVAAERLPNGTVIVRDMASRKSFLVHETVTANDEADLDEVQLDLVELGPLEEVLHAIEVASTVTFACQAALDAVEEVAPAESGSVILEQSGTLRFLAAFGPVADRLVGMRLPLGTGVAGYSMGRREVVVLDEAARDPRFFGGMDERTGHTTRQMACLPVLTEDDRALGVLQALNLPVGQVFSREMLDQLRIVAGTLGKRLSR